MRIVRISLHSFVLAVANVGCIIIGFRVNKLITHQIVVQVPISGFLCVIVFVSWWLFIRYFSFKNLLGRGTNELIWIYLIALLWSPMIFIPVHYIKWGYMTSITDISAIWFFQLLVNILAIFTTNQLSGNVRRSTLGFSVKRPKSKLPNIMLALASGIFSLVIAEFLLQKFYDLPLVVSGWRSLASEFENNQLGFRGQPIKYTDDDFVIVIIGDSEVEALACAYRWMPERRLQYHLNSLDKQVKVFSLAASGYGQDQQLLALQEYYQTYRADMVILWQVPGNDVWNNMFPTGWPANGTPKPTFWLEDGELHGPSEQMGSKLEMSAIKLIALWQLAFASKDRDGAWEKYLPPPYSPMTKYDGPVNKKWQEWWDTNFAQKRYENLDNEKSHYAMSLTPRSKRMEYGLELTKKLLQKIKKLVTFHNGQFMIFRRVAPLKDNSIPDGVYVLHGKYYTISRKQRESNIQYINEGFQFYSIPVTIEEYRVGPLDSHLNEHATDQVMRDLAKILQQFIPDKDLERNL